MKESIKTMEEAKLEKFKSENVIQKPKPQPEVEKKAVS